MIRLGLNSAENASAIMEKISELMTDSDRTECFVETFEEIKRIAGKSDPYEELKEKFNEAAFRSLELIREIRPELLAKPSSILKLSAVANMADTQVLGFNGRPEHMACLLENLNVVVDESRIIDMLENRNVMIILDNAGEAVFDIELAKRLSIMGNDVTIVARHYSYEIDVTFDEVSRLLSGYGLKVLSTMSSYPFFYPKNIPEKLLSEARRSDIVISKGIANLEAYIDYHEYYSDINVVFAFNVKCDVLSDLVGVRKGSSLVITGDRLLERVRKNIRENPRLRGFIRVKQSM